jgi:molybdopterin molybdotransferase
VDLRVGLHPGCGVEVLNPPADWLTLAEASARVLAAGGRPTEPVLLSPAEAGGLALAQPLIASRTLPPMDSSAMDGYALRGEEAAGASPDRPRRFKVVGLLRPGSLPHIQPAPGEAIRILTGAPIPAGTDSVIRVEDTDGEREDGWVVVSDDRDVGRNVRPAGEDVEEGETLLLSGHTVDPGSLALMAALGVRSIAVHPRPRVALISTGDELVPAFNPLPGDAPPSPVVDSNGPALALAIAGAGGLPIGPRIVGDDGKAQEEVFREAAEEADLLVVTGGASMGEADLVKRVLDRMGFRLDFWRVTIRPGSPFGFGLLPRKDRAPLPVAGLPGNPASALVTFEILVRPLVRALGGHSRRSRIVLDARAGAPLPGAGRNTHLVRVTLHREEGWVARPAGPQRSNLLAPMARAHGIAEVPPGPAGGIPEGGAVRVHLLTPDGW